MLAPRVTFVDANQVGWLNTSAHRDGVTFLSEVVENLDIESLRAEEIMTQEDRILRRMSVSRDALRENWHILGVTDMIWTILLINRSRQQAP